MEEQTEQSNDATGLSVPQQDTTFEEEETSPPQGTSADPLTQIADALNKLLVARSPREIDVSPYDGTFEAQSFFDNFDAQADRAKLTYTDRLRKLPCYLQDLFPTATEASFSRFLAIKLTPQMPLEEYYQNKTVMGMKLNLPADILIDSLTEGLPVADQRLIATVQPSTIKEWFDLVSRIRRTQCATSAVYQRQVDKAPHPTYHNPPPRHNNQRSSRVTYQVAPPPSPCKYCNAMHWHSQCEQRFQQDRTRQVYSARPRTATVPKSGTRPKVQSRSPVPQVQDDSTSPASNSTMTRMITAQYYWKGISKSIEKFVKSCHTCQIIKRPKDTIAGISKYGHSKTYLHVIVDHLTRYAWTFPSKSTSTLTYIQTLKTKMEREEALERLKKKRTILRTSLSKYGKRIEEYDVHKECDHEELLGQLSDVYEELRRVDEEIGKLIVIKDLEKDLKMVEEYREKAVAWKYLLKKRSLVVAEGMQRETATATKKEYPGEIGRPTLTGMVKLPKLTMERFYGEISQWLNFWNAFDSSINRNEHLTKIDKFNYLKAYLGGTAAQTVEGFCLSEENYDKAVELLKKRFGKGERLIDVHMNNLLALKPLRVTKDVRAFRELYGRILVQIRSLESLGVVVESYGNLLCPLLLKLLPSDLKLELHREFTGAFSLGDLIEFLERQLIALESTFGTRDEITAGQPSNEHPQSQSSIVKYRRNERNPLPTAAGFLNASEAVNKRKNCAFCERDHESTKCEFAENLTLEDKLGKLKKKGACFRCLKYGHLSKFCKVKTSCTSCGELRHSRIMCPRKNQNATPAREMMRDETLTNLTTPVVLLPTLRVTIRGMCKERMGRILINTGSQRSYVLQDTAEEMGYECSKKESLRHSLFGGSNTELYEHGVYDIRLSNLDGSYGCNFEALSQDVICDSVPRVHQGKWMQDLSAHDIELTDLHRGPLEILIGADIAGKLLTGEHRRLPSGLVAVQTRLGWTLMGKIPATEEETSVSGLCTTSLLTSDLENLWRLEAIGISDARQDDSIQKETEEYFARTISQDCEGRYQVALPWIRERELLTDNRDVAEKRLANVRKHLVNTGNLAEYEDILEKWLRNKIIERVIDNKREGVHYLSHRPVFKENSPTTKVRPVFDASAKKKGKLSLNDCLERGPNMIETIPRILNKFRKSEIGVSSDIEKAFLQIGIREEDRDYLRFLWYDKEGNVVVLRHARVVFGITTSPYLLLATLFHHLNKAPEHWQETAELLRESLYIDNCVASFSKVTDMEKFVDEAQRLLASAHFNLRDWTSNVTSIMCDGPRSDRGRLLGMTWNQEKDTLACSLENLEIQGPINKSRLILQETWLLKLSWDEPLPENLSCEFLRWLAKLESLKSIAIPRWLCYREEHRIGTTLHVFCDASRASYATCIFLRIESEQEVTCQLVQARSRVAPLKGTTIPRLELLACLVGARLVNNVVRDLKFEDMERFYWTDSMNALHWIKGKDNWATFVMNRVMEIRSLNIVNSEKRKIVLTSTCIEREKDQYYYRFSNYYKILRVTAWMNRFLTNARGTIGQRVKGDLTVNEIKRAELMLVRVIQRESFTGPEDKRLKDFKLCCDSLGLLRVKTKIESLMNSRPLTYMSEDVEDLSPLTPALFLHDLKEIGVPDLDSIERASLQKRYRFRQRLREDLRKRFRTEYFGFLRQETRRRSKTRPIKVGDLVLIGQDNAKRVNWPLARVVEVYPGRDGPVRVAKLRTSKGVQIRPVQRLYNLEIPADLGSTLRSIQSEPRRGGSRGEASKDPTKIAKS
ncbi:hypothetical protein LAZ67_8000420 [Cordylochernes scorpioides]|uniref:CCHC-type domain-containing protein n=1 Tax=Cordylochernes scorpioides TaxID=51811 RepID=A0ABY6KT11_9ARAC|nr:hypothetical protein LAZ67_8000420 [Cordylochernes scorpioides]